MTPLTQHRVAKVTLPSQQAQRFVMLCIAVAYRRGFFCCATLPRSCVPATYARYIKRPLHTYFGIIHTKQSTQHYYYLLPINKYITRHTSKSPSYQTTTNNNDGNYKHRCCLHKPTRPHHWPLPRPAPYPLLATRDATCRRSNSIAPTIAKHRRRVERKPRGACALGHRH